MPIRSMGSLTPLPKELVKLIRKYNIKERSDVLKGDCMVGIGGTCHGLSRIYDDGTLVREEIYKHGLCHGKTSYWVPKNNTYYLCSVIEYKDGKIHGKYKRYYWNGNPRDEYTFIYGIQQASSIGWSEDGTIRNEFL